MKDATVDRLDELAQQILDAATEIQRIVTAQLEEKDEDRRRS